jgi:hypothetical protein
MKAIYRSFLGLIPLLLASCGDAGRDAAWWDAERERVELANRLELTNYRYDRMGGREASAEYERVRKEVAALRPRLELARAQVSRLGGEIASVEKEFTAVRERAKAERRANWVGARFPDLRAASGRLYLEVRVAAVNDAGVTIRHRDGSARLGWSDLDPRQREMFVLEERAARAAEEEEKRQALAYEKWLEEELRLQHQRERDLVVASAPKQTRSRTSAALSNVKPVAASPLSEPARRMSNYAPRTRRSSTTYYYYGSYPSCYPTLRYATPASIADQFTSQRSMPVTPVMPVVPPCSSTP